MPRSSKSNESSEPPKIRWAARLPPRLLRRLYEADARGFRDSELCDEVGLRLYERCRAFVLVARGEMDCPACGQEFAVSVSGTSHCPSQRCAWSTTHGQYLESIRNHYAHTGRALTAFTKFYRRYPAAKTYAEKIVQIDQLIHSFHIDEAIEAPTKSVASKLLEGNKNEVVRFLDRLSAVNPAEKDRWRRTVSETIHRRLLGTHDH